MKKEPKEYIAFLHGKHLDSNGRFTQYGVTAYTLKNAKTILSEARKHYGYVWYPHGSYIKCMDPEKTYHPPLFR